MADLPRPFLAVHQPNYAPWLGYFVKAAAADAFVLLDDVQFPKASWVHRTHVLGPAGKEYLSIPVRHPGLALIRDVRIADPRWLEKHRRKIQAYYHGAPGLDAALGLLEPEGLEGQESLSAANEVVLRRAFEALGGGTRTVRSSEFGLGDLDPTDRHIEFCRRLGAKTYLSGRGASAYNDPGRFRAAGIALAYLEFDHPAYDQGSGEFTAGLSVLDVLARAGGSAADLLRAAVAGARFLEARPSA